MSSEPLVSGMFRDYRRKNIGQQGIPLSHKKRNDFVISVEMEEITRIIGNEINVSLFAANQYYENNLAQSKSAKF